MGLHKFKNRISYEFDKTLTKGIGTLIWWLAVTTIFIVTIITTLVWFLNLSSDNSFFDQLWFFLLRSIGDDYYVKTPWLYRVLYLLIIFSNLFIMSVLIGILTQVIQKRIEKLRKGHSKIIEKDHTIILGWSSLIFTILNEFETSARDEGKKMIVVILGNKDKVFMEDEIKRNVKPLKKVRVICRSGEASVKSHLEIISLQTAKAIIILSIHEKNSDNEVIKILLAINGFINHKKKEINSKDEQNKRLDRIFSRIITQIEHKKNKKICNIITNNKAMLVNIKEFTAKIIAQTARQSGLPNVYEELFDYKGMEIYFIENEFENITYNELLLMYNDISVIGYIENNKPLLNPDKNTVIYKENKLIVIAESLKKANKKISYNKLLSKVTKECKSESILSNQILILGWNSIGNSILKELSSYIKPGKKMEITIVPNKNANTPFNIEYNPDKLFIFPDLKRDFYDYEYLKETIKSKSFNSVILLSDEKLDIQESDVKNITILHFIRDIEKDIKIEQKDKQTLFNIDIVCQLKDDKNQELITDFHKNDFVVSAKFASLYYSQISQNLDLFKVFKEILSEEGSEIYFKKATDYFNKDEVIHYIDVVELVSLNNETAIGYYTDKSNSELNLCKSDEITVKKTDKIILLEETVNETNTKKLKQISFGSANL